MKRYLIFAYEGHYPSGGVHDMRSQSFDTVEEAKDFLLSPGGPKLYDFVDIVDRETMRIVWNNR